MLKQIIKQKLLILIIVPAVLIIAVVEIWTNNRLAVYGEQINSIEATITNVEQENRILAMDLAQKSAISSIDLESEQLGFKSTKNIEYLKNIDIALNR